jgi:hypothetical protein
MRLPSGSFTLDREGRIMTSTLPQSFPASQMREIGARVLASFRTAKKAQMPLSEIIVHYAALKILARELRGGAIVFLMPQGFSQNLRKQITNGSRL